MIFDSFPDCFCFLTVFHLSESWKNEVLHKVKTRSNFLSLHYEVLYKNYCILFTMSEDKFVFPKYLLSCVIWIKKISLLKDSRPKYALTLRIHALHISLVFEKLLLWHHCRNRLYSLVSPDTLSRYSTLL